MADELIKINKQLREASDEAKKKTEEKYGEKFDEDDDLSDFASAESIFEKCLSDLREPDLGLGEWKPIDIPHMRYLR